MSVRGMAGPLALVLGISLAVRAAMASLIAQPGYMDAYYYYDIARNLYEGRGFVEDFTWNYLQVPDTLTNPSNLYWMPLTSLVLYPSFVLLGEGFRAAQVPMVLLSAALPAISYWLGWDVFGSRRYAWIMALLTIFSGVFFVYWVVPDTFGPFAVAGSLSLIFAFKGLRDRSWWLVTSGAMAGLAHLARPDGALLLVATFVAVLGYRLSGRVRPERQGRGADKGAAVAHLRLRFLLALAGALAAYALVLAPWLIRNQAAFGTPLPGLGAQTIFLTEYDDIFAFDSDVSLSSYLAWGWRNIVESKLSASLANLRLLSESLLFVMAPLAAVGAYVVRRRVEYLPFFVYLALLLATMSWVFTFPGPRGSFFHSLSAALPFLFGLAVVGLDQCVARLSSLLSHWNCAQAQKNFGVILVGAAIVASLGLGVREAYGWDGHYRAYSEIAAWMGQHGDGGPVMLADPPGFFYVSGSPGVVYPDGYVEAALQVACRYGVRFLALDASHPRELHSLYIGKESHPLLSKAAAFSGVVVYRIGDGSSVACESTK